jgi:predicted peptidase
MKSPFLLLTILTGFIISSCNDESEQITPQPRPAIQKDSISSATAVAETQTPTDSILTTDNELDFRDSAYYQHGKHNSMPYRVMVPSDYDASKKYPLVIFLHGIDERGTDNEKQLKWGASLFKSDSVRNRYPAFTIFPQCPIDYYWASDVPMQQLKALIDNFASTNNVDRDRIYIVGISMGAYGTYELVARNPGMFAAAIAISGDGDLSRAHHMAKTQWKIYGGKKDQIVTSDKAEKWPKD